MVDVFYDMPDEQYHAETGLGEGLWITRSMIHLCMKSPHGFWLRYVRKHPVILEKVRKQNEDKDCFKLGRFLESRINGSFADKYTLGLPPPPYKGEGAKARREEWRTENALHLQGKTECTSEHVALAELCIESLEAMTSLRVRDIQLGGKHGVVIRWHDKKTGLPLQVQLDTLLGNYVFDYKHTAKSLAKFHSTADEYGYISQDVMYSEACLQAFGVIPTAFLFVVMQSADPYEAGVITLRDDARQIVSAQLRSAVDTIASGEYHSASKLSTVADVPAYWLHANDFETGGIGELFSEEVR